MKILQRAGEREQPLTNSRVKFHINVVSLVGDANCGMPMNMKYEVNKRGRDFGENQHRMQDLSRQTINSA